MIIMIIIILIVILIIIIIIVLMIMKIIHIYIYIYCCISYYTTLYNITSYSTATTRSTAALRGMLCNNILCYNTVYVT